MATHFMYDGKLQVYQRENSSLWQCAARVGGRRFRKSTGTDSISEAKDIADDWYLGLRGKLRGGEIVNEGPTFQQAADRYLKEAAVLAETARSPNYVPYITHKLERHILPVLGKLPLSRINRGAVQEYRIRRHEESMARLKRAPSRSTMLKEITYIRQVLKTAEGLGWIPYVPNLSLPYLTTGKRGRRAWFSPEEYKKLYQATAKRIDEGKRPGWRSRYEDMHDYVLFMANTGLRPDEAAALEFRDIKIEKDPGTQKVILTIDVRGKTGVGYCKSMPGAVMPLRRLLKRRTAELLAEHGEDADTEKLLLFVRVFPQFHRDMFNKILEEEGLKFDRDGNRRTAYSLRHTYISMRLMEGANIHMIANNCRTSVPMIEQFYASHIKDRLDASLLNVKRPSPPKPPKVEAKPVKSKGPKSRQANGISVPAPH